MSHRYSPPHSECLRLAGNTIWQQTMCDLEPLTGDWKLVKIALGPPSSYSISKTHAGAGAERIEFLCGRGD